MICSCSPGTYCINHANAVHPAHSLASPPLFLLTPEDPHAWFLLPSDFSGFILPSVPLGLWNGDWEALPDVSHCQEGGNICIFCSKLPQVTEQYNNFRSLGFAHHPPKLSSVYWALCRSFLHALLTGPHSFPAYSCDSLSAPWKYEVDYFSYIY